MHLQHDVVCPTLIGRDAQLESLRRVLAQARDGTGRVALIVGEAGVGKSRLLRAMTEEARGAGFFVLAGRLLRGRALDSLRSPARSRAALRAARRRPRSSRTCSGPPRAISYRCSRSCSRILPDATPNSERRSRVRSAAALSRAGPGRNATRAHATRVPRLRGRALERRRDARADLSPRAQPRGAAGRHRAHVSRRGGWTATRAARHRPRARARRLRRRRSSDSDATDVGAMLQAIFGPRQKPRRRVRSRAPRTHRRESLLR